MIGGGKLTKQGLPRPPQSASLVGANATISSDRGKWGSESLYLNSGGATNYVTFRRAQANLFPSKHHELYGNGTIEFWIYKLTNPSTNSLIYHMQEVSTEIAIVTSTNGNFQGRCRFGATTYSTTAVNLSNNSWHHVALTLDDNYYLTLWANGNRIGTVGTGIAGDTLITSGGNWGLLGTATARYYINDFRISTVARYNRNNSTYTTPSAEFVNDADTYCLFHFNGNDDNGTEIFDDVSPTNTTPTEIPLVIKPNGNAQTLGSFSYWPSTANLTLDGTGDYLSVISYRGKFVFGTGDFTVQCWVRGTNGLTNRGIFQFANNTSGIQNSATGNLAAAFYTTGNGWRIRANGNYDNTSGGPSEDTWYHIALIRYNGTTKFYVDGTARITVENDNTNYSFTSLAIGGYDSTATLLQGYIQDFMVCKVARWTANFTKPSSRVDDDSNTVFLLRPTGDDNGGIFTSVVP